MKRYSLYILSAALVSCLIMSEHVAADVVGIDDFFYNQPTKPLGPGGGFTLQDYGGGGTGTAGRWTGRWTSSGNGIVTGEDFEEVDNQFLALTAAGLTPVTANFVARNFELNSVQDSQPLYFAVQSRVDDGAAVQPRFWINSPVGDPLLDDGQISIGYDDFGIVAELGLDFESNDDDPVNDGDDHLLVGKLELNAAGNNERLTLWLDPSGVETGTSVTVENDVLDSYGDLRGNVRLGRLNDGSAIYWDDIAIGTSWDDVASVDVARLTLRVDPNSGSTSLVNQSDSDMSINYYEILSDSGNLNVDGWSGLDQQNVPGWLMNNPSASRITESNFAGDSLLAAGASLPLGTVYEPGSPQNLVARVGTPQGLLNLALVDYVEGQPRRGDFNRNDIIDAQDMDLLSDEVTAGTNNVAFDLTGDGLVNTDDRDVWVRDEEIANTYYGDSNLNGEFDSGDLVDVFVAGEYEDGIPMNSTWATGDWDGNRDFNSSDIVLAFTDGGYELGPRMAQPIPEPSALTLLALAGLGLLRIRRR